MVCKPHSIDVPHAAADVVSMLVRILLCVLLTIFVVGGIYVVENKLQARSTKTAIVKRRANEKPDPGASEDEANAD